MTYRPTRSWNCFFLRRVTSISLRDKVSSVFHEELGVQPMLLCFARTQLRSFGHLVRMPSGHFAREVFHTRSPARRKPCSRQVQAERLYHWIPSGSPSLLLQVLAIFPTLPLLFFLYNNNPRANTVSAISNWLKKSNCLWCLSGINIGK